MNTTVPVSPRPVSITPIGIVAAPFSSVEGGCDYVSESRILLRPELAPGLVGIEYFSHLWVIYHQHRSAEWLRARGWEPASAMILPPDDDRAGLGVFSSRAPCRPAQLGSSIVGLTRREKNVLWVRGLDALDGTPVLDVKPYVPQFDAFPEAIVPQHWAKVMDRPGDAARLSRELHWDTSNSDCALGLRSGVAILQRLGLARGAPLSAELSGSPFFAHGFEMATGCSPLRGTLAVTPRTAGERPWRLRVFHRGEATVVDLKRIAWPDAASVLTASENELFETPRNDAAASETPGPAKAPAPCPS